MNEESVVERGDSKGGRLSVSLSSANEATHYDQNDMARLGKPQQFKVSHSSSLSPGTDGIES